MMRFSRPYLSSVHGFEVSLLERMQNADSTITCNTCDCSFDSVIYRKEILYNDVYLRIEPLVLHDLVRGAVFPGRMVILRYCIATDLFSGSRVRELSECVSFRLNVAKF